jgi:hypothetical protein
LNKLAILATRTKSPSSLKVSIDFIYLIGFVDNMDGTYMGEGSFDEEIDGEDI